MKAKYYAALMAAAFTLLVISVPVQASKTDARIESSARKSYVFKTHLKDDDINIQSKEGAVTLTGLVAEEFHKALAKETVVGLRGVKSVDNRLEIKGAPPTANSDAWLKDKVKLMFTFHRSVISGNTEVDVKDGIVILRGIAISQAQKELTAEYARDVDGVKDIKNEMALSKIGDKTIQTSGEKVDDTSITAQVKMALLLHQSTSALQITVKTKHGVVTLGGEAKNTAEKNQVAKLVSDIHGVKNVDNRMTIK